MRGFSPLTLAVTIALAGAGAPLLAQAAKPAAPAAPAAPAQPGQPTQAQVENAAFEMQVLVSAMASDKVEGPAKNALFECLFGNSLAVVDDAVEKVAAQNVGKFDRRNPDQVLAVMLSVCGFRPQEAAAPAAGTPAPATPARPQGQGR